MNLLSHEFVNILCRWLSTNTVFTWKQVSFLNLHLSYRKAVIHQVGHHEIMAHHLEKVSHQRQIHQIINPTTKINAVQLRQTIITIR